MGHEKRKPCEENPHRAFDDGSPRHVDLTRRPARYFFFLAAFLAAFLAGAFFAAFLAGFFAAFLAMVFVLCLLLVAFCFAEEAELPPRTFFPAAAVLAARFSSIAACAAARRATGTRKGLQLT